MNANELMLNDWVRHIDEKEHGQVYEIRNDFIEIGSGPVRIAIPYNDDTKHLIGTMDDCPEYYKWWEK